MGTPVRTLIRNAVCTNAVLGNLTTTGANCFKGRYQAVKPGKLPCIFVRLTTQQSRGLESMGWPRDQTISARLSVVAAAKSEGDVDAALDLIDQEVRIAIATAIGPGGALQMVKRADYEGITEYGEDDENEDIAAASIEFNIEFATPENAPDVPL